jgi:hypothetical protein
MISDLELKLSNANLYLEAAYQKEKEQKELMLQLQMQLDKLMQNKSNDLNCGSIKSILSNNNINNSSQPINKQSHQQQGQQQINKIASQLNIESASLSIYSKQRAKTAPNTDINGNSVSFKLFYDLDL